MLRFTRNIVILALILLIHISLVPGVKNIRSNYVKETFTRIGSTPSSVLKLIVLEFQGIAADLLLLNTISFMGYNIGSNETLENEDWQIIFQTLDRITDLDPAFWDPYVFAETMLTWQAGMIKEADYLLQKATKSRDNDYRPFYYLGFNAFYFRHRASEAAPHLREAAKRPNAPSYLAALASRMSLYGSQTVMGIMFLEEVIAETYDPITKQSLELRIDSLKKIFTLEQAVIQYKNDHQNFPQSLDILVKEGYIRSVPIDPYGGSFILLNNGKVYTSSNLLKQNSQ